MKPITITTYLARLGSRLLPAALLRAWRRRDVAISPAAELPAGSIAPLY